MRALLITVLVVIVAASAGVVFLAISPAPQGPSDSLTLVIESGPSGATRAASGDDETDGSTSALANAGASTEESGREPSLDEVIAARLQDADRRKKAQAQLSDGDARAGAAPSAQPEDKPGESGASAQRRASADTGESDFEPPQESSPPPGTVSITQMLAAELNDGDSAAQDEPSSAGSDDVDPGTAPAPAPSLMAAETGGAAASPSEVSPLVTTGSQAAGTDATTQPGAADETSQADAGEASESTAPDGSDSQEETVAALDPRVAEDGSPRKQAETSADEAEATGEPQDPAEQPAESDAFPQRLAAADAPAVPEKRGAFKLQGKIALIIRGLGVSAELTERAIAEMPSQVAMAFVPYGDDLKTWTRRAKQERHDVLIQIPLEPEDYPDTDPGPHTLLTSLSIDENLERLDWILDRFSGLTGVTNYLGEKFASAPSAFAPMLMELKARELLYVDDSKAANPTTRQLARQVSLAYSVADVVIDEKRSPDAIAQALGTLEETAKANGSAIAVGHAHSDTLAALEKWLTTLDEKGLALVPITELTTPPPARVSQSTGG